MLTRLVDRSTVRLTLIVCVMIESLLAVGLCATTGSEACDEFHKECHCGSIATPPYTSLFTKIAYPNSTKKVIEEYDDDIPYGYKYLRVYYRCTNEKNVLVGNNMRECSNGNWVGQVPRCAVNTLNKTKLKIIKINDYRMNPIEDSAKQNNSNQTDSEEEDRSKPFNIFVIYYDDSIKLDPNGTFEVPLAKQPNHCLRWSLSPRQIWNLHLAKQTRVHYVRIKLYGDHIEDLYLKHEISIEMALKNISHFESENRSSVELPIEIRCRETTPKASQFETYQQKYSANYLVLDFLCEIENRERSVFEFMFANDYEVDQLNAGLIEISFQMLNIAQYQGKENTNIVFQPKISVISLCELKLYSFSNNCGEPDLPVSAIVQSDFTYFGRKSFKYICADKNDEIIGKPSVECGQYGKWMSEFPKCAPSRPCNLLDNLIVQNGYQIDLVYETTIKAKNGKEMVPNGKYAKFSCHPLNATSLKEENEHNTSGLIEPYSWRNRVNVICRNGQWIGFESTDHTCIRQPQAKEKILSASIVDETSHVNHNINSSSQVISLPLRAIKILFALFVILCLIIVALLIYMVMFRHKMARVNSIKEHCMSDQIDLCHNYMVPTIVYNENQETEYSGAIYSSVTDFYDRISLGQSESHLYHTIKGSRHYSDLSIYSKNSELNLEIDQGEERVNSIYGIEDESDEMCHSATAETSSANRARLSEKDYNQLSRSSSGYLKKNSIYET